MREILFRSKRLDNEKWIYGGYQFEHGFGNPLHYIVEYSTFGAFTVNNLIEVYSDTVGQFTGLLDKSGNKIFEGDILKIDYIDELCYVSYNEENTLFEIHFKKDREPLGLSNYSHNIEVIGNIHDNSELYREIKEINK